MEKENNHTVRKISWNTSCYDADLANKFQNSLSNWSNLNLPILLEEVFNEMVPENETWYIDKISIDIGPITMESLENETRYLDEHNIDSDPIAREPLEKDIGNKVRSELKKQLLQSIQNNNHKTKPKEDTITEGLYIKNAGLVLISAYFPMLFQTLQLSTENKFNSPKKQRSAVLYLQYLATRISNTEEKNLPLNNILCGLDPTPPHASEIEITEADNKLISEMIEAIIAHWTAIAGTSVDSFHTTWLMREGILKEEADKWTLHVERKAYDLLIQQAPFSFSFIKFPWMKKPLHVNWSY